MCYTQNRFNALLSACVMPLIATTGWSQSLTWLGTLGGSSSEAWSVSADGSVVVGGAWNAAGRWRAFRWTASGGMRNLGTLGGDESEAYSVSADGAVVVGRAYNAAGQRRAFRWTAAEGMQDLGTLPNGYQSRAYGVSADGSVVVGWSVGNVIRAFRWENGVLQSLDTPYPLGSRAYGVSADGSVVVGSAVGSSPTAALRWTAARGWGWEDLNMTYTLWTYPSELYEARAISPDGRYIVGWGRNPATNRIEAFLLDTRLLRCAPDGDVNCDGIVDDADLLIVLFNFGNRYR